MHITPFLKSSTAKNIIMKHIAVILSGGSGQRMGGTLPKQFIVVGGRTILEHSVEAFHRHADIDGILIVSNPDYVERVRELAAQNRDRWTKLCGITVGGKERSDSSRNAIRFLEENGLVTPDTCLLIHDAVRPLVSGRIISDVCHALQHYGAVGVGIPATDTMIMTKPDGKCIAAMPDRSTLMRVQTPQGFRYDVIRRAYALAANDLQFHPTDDCGVVFRYMPDEPMAIVAGDVDNIKITYPQDLSFLENRLGNNKDTK